MRPAAVIVLCLLAAATIPAALTQGSLCDSIASCSTQLVRQGDKGSCVAVIQTIVGATPDGDFGPKTAKAVQAYQSSKGLDADAIVGPKTWAAMSAGCVTTPPSPVQPLPIVTPPVQPTAPVVVPRSPVQPTGSNCPGIPAVAVTVIKRFERYVKHAYRDSGSPDGLPITIGYGSTSYENGDLIKLGDTISEPAAAKLLSWFVSMKCLPTLRRKVPYWSQMNDNQRSALISFCYNAGPGFYGHPLYRQITKALKYKRWSDVPRVMALYNKGDKHEILQGLVTRRKLEGNLWKKAPGALRCA